MYWLETRKISTANEIMICIHAVHETELTGAVEQTRLPHQDSNHTCRQDEWRWDGESEELHAWCLNLYWNPWKLAELVKTPAEVSHQCIPLCSGQHSRGDYVRRCCGQLLYKDRAMDDFGESQAEDKPGIWNLASVSTCSKAPVACKVGVNSWVNSKARFH